MPKRAAIEFVPCADEKGAALRFGGEPFGLPGMLWPRSRSTDEPMQFICQIPFGPELFPGTVESMAYLFMADSAAAEETWDPDAGNNSVVILERNKLTGTLTTGEVPRLHRMVKKWWLRRLVAETCIFSARLTVSEEPSFVPESRLSQMPETEERSYLEILSGNKLGGSPAFLQNEELPFAEPWHLLLQLDSTRVPFCINFGDLGVGYAFINQRGTEGKFLWQCC